MGGGRDANVTPGPGARCHMFMTIPPRCFHMRGTTSLTGAVGAKYEIKQSTGTGLAVFWDQQVFPNIMATIHSPRKMLLYIAHWYSGCFFSGREFSSLHSFIDRHSQISSLRPQQNSLARPDRFPSRCVSNGAAKTVQTSTQNSPTDGPVNAATSFS